MMDEGVDVAIRIGPLQDSSYQAVRVGQVRRMVCASPSYLEEHGVPLAPADLARHVWFRRSASRRHSNGALPMKRRLRSCAFNHA